VILKRPGGELGGRGFVAAMDANRRSWEDLHGAGARVDPAADLAGIRRSLHSAAGAVWVTVTL